MYPGAGAVHGGDKFLTPTGRYYTDCPIIIVIPRVKEIMHMQPVTVLPRLPVPMHNAQCELFLSTHGDRSVMLLSLINACCVYFYHCIAIAILLL